MVSLRGKLRYKHYPTLQKMNWKQVGLHIRHLDPEFISVDTPTSAFPQDYTYTKYSNLSF